MSQTTTVTVAVTPPTDNITASASKGTIEGDGKDTTTITALVTEADGVTPAGAGVQVLVAETQGQGSINGQPPAVGVTLTTDANGQVSFSAVDKAPTGDTMVFTLTVQ